MFEDKLAAYEASGLTPEEVMEYATAKKNKRAFIIPFSVGDPVYVVTWINGVGSAKLHDVVECHVTKILFRNNGTKILYTCQGMYSRSRRAYSGTFILESIGKSVFFTSEEAHKRMNELNKKVKIEIPYKVGDTVYYVKHYGYKQNHVIKLTVCKVDPFGFVHNGVWKQVLLTDNVAYESTTFENFGYEFFLDEQLAIQNAKIKNEGGIW